MYTRKLPSPVLEKLPHYQAAGLEISANLTNQQEAHTIDPASVALVTVHIF